MSKFDVVSSLLRSSARSAATTLSNTPLGAAVRRALSEASPGRVAIRDDQLTRAVARVRGIAAATVSSGGGRIRFQLGCDDGAQFSMSLRPSGMAFAIGGAKELFFSVEPSEAAHDSRSRDALAAIAGEIARTLWRPVLLRAPHSDHSAFVTSDQDKLVVDLRTVPEVRWALSQRLPRAVIEALRPRALEAHDGKLLLLLAFDRLG